MGLPLELSGFVWSVVTTHFEANVYLHTYNIIQAYHDVATHNVTDGTGGLDASIYYEFNRPEVLFLYMSSRASIYSKPNLHVYFEQQNIGAGNLNTLTDFANSPTTLVSRK